MGNVCGDNRFEIIRKAKGELLESTNIDTSEDEMGMIDSFLFRCWQMGWLDRYDKPREPLDIPTMTTDFVKEHGLPCPDGYEFRDENGNVIQAKKIVLEKKKPEWPKTYEECAQIMRMQCKWRTVNIKSTGILVRADDYELPLAGKIDKFMELIICRDAYWEIVGKDLGLNNRWKPSYANGFCSYAIIRHTGHIRKSRPCANSVLLEFPTEEMRDAFYENFKDLIEECKELL